MTVKKAFYPSTLTQQATARRKGWVVDGKGKWKPPKTYSFKDAARISFAEMKRKRRGRSAD